LKGYLNTSDSQFGFKKESGCLHAIYTVRSTVDYFTKNNSTVNLCALDVSKAFDKTNNNALILKLMDRKVPRNFILILKCWFAKVFVTVRWKSSFFTLVSLKAGVRQGGIYHLYYLHYLLIMLLLN